MLIVFEGGEGVGKSTQVELLHDALNNKKIPVLKTREPGGTLFAEKIRGLFKHVHDEAPTPLTELFLIAAARAQHIEKVLIPAQKTGTVVLCDRFIDSTYVYQCLLGGVEKHVVDSCMKHALFNIKPDVTFVFDCNIETARKRLHHSRGHQKSDRYDDCTSDIQQKILNGYKTILDQKFAYPDGTVPVRVRIDSTQSIDDIFHTIKQTLNQKCGLNL